MAAKSSPKSASKAAQSPVANPRQAVNGKTSNGASKGVNSSVAANKGQVTKGKTACKSGKSK